MDIKTKRKYLNDFSRARRNLELTEVAINALEQVSNARSIRKALRAKQQVHLRRLDTAAKKLGAPYAS